MTTADETTSTTGMDLQQPATPHKDSSASECDTPDEFAPPKTIGIGRARPKLIRERGDFVTWDKQQLFQRTYSCT